MHVGRTKEIELSQKHRQGNHDSALLERIVSIMKVGIIAMIYFAVWVIVVFLIVRS